jgi:HlyD family secretion protein
MAHVNKPEEPGAEPDINAIFDARADGPGGWWKSRYIIWAAITAAVVVLVGYWLLVGFGSAGQVRYLTNDITRGDLTVIVTATGTVQPTNTVDVSSELSGVIRKVLVDYNASVKAGEPLAELDTDKLKAQVDHANATLNAAKAKVDEAKATVAEQKLTYERKQHLLARQATSQQDLDAAKAAYDRAIAGLGSAKAQVAVAEADLRVNETNLAKACICSPVNGIVLERAVEPGQTVATSLQAPVLFVIAEDLKQMELQVDIDEADVGSVREGQEAFFTVDAYPDRTFPARIEQLRYGSEEVEGVVTYKAVLRVDNEALLLRPGMTATAEIVVKRVKDALLVPNAALRFSPPSEKASEAPQQSLISMILPRRPSFRKPSEREGTGADRVLWVLRDGAPADVPVTVGATDGARTEILGGDVKAGQPVIVDAETARK